MFRSGLGGLRHTFTLLERFSNLRALSRHVQGGFFLRKKPLGILPSVYSNWRTAIGIVSETKPLSLVEIVCARKEMRRHR
jgi:hypothetical protein